MNVAGIIKNAAYLFTGNIGVRAITALSIILLARTIGPKEYGIFAIAVAVSGIAGYFVDLGLTETYIREANRKKTDIAVLLGSYIKVRILFAIGSIIVSFVFINILYSNPHIVSIINWIVYPTIIGQTLQGIAYAFFQSNEQMGYSSSLTVIQGVLTAASTFAAIIFNWSLDLLAPIYGSSLFVSGIIAIILLSRHAKVARGWNRNLLDQLLAFTINGIIIMALPQLGPIILEKVTTLKSVGFFSAAFKIPSVLYQIPGVVASAFYPRLFLFGNMKDEYKHRKLSGIELKLMSFIGMAISLPFIIKPEFWIVGLFGGKWIHASPALAIMSYMIILQSINYPLADYLTTKGYQYKRMIVMSCGLFVALVSYSILGHYFGIIGGAMSPLLVELTLFLGFCSFIKKSISFVFDGIKFNAISFLICRILAFFIPNYFELMWMIIIGLLYFGIVFVLDKSLLRQIISFIHERKAT